MTVEGRKAIAGLLGVSTKRLRTLLRTHPEMPVQVEGCGEGRRYLADDKALAGWRLVWLKATRVNSGTPGATAATP